MNERIKELYNEASKDLDLTQDILQKFAELIIRECVQQVKEAIPETACASSGAYRTARIAAIARINKHFGVSE